VHQIHAYAALTLFLGFLLHIGGVYKHTAFNQDGTLVKMIVADRKSTAAKPETDANTGGGNT
jgi:cytochrome b561